MNRQYESKGSDYRHRLECRVLDAGVGCGAIMGAGAIDEIETDTSAIIDRMVTVRFRTPEMRIIAIR